MANRTVLNNEIETKVNRTHVARNISEDPSLRGKESVEEGARKADGVSATGGE